MRINDRQSTLIFCVLLALASVGFLIRLLQQNNSEYAAKEQIRSGAWVDRNVHNKAVYESTISSSSRIDHVVALPDAEFLVIVSGSDEQITIGKGGGCFLRFASSKEWVAATIVSNSAGDGGRRVIRCRGSGPLQSGALEMAMIGSKDKMIVVRSQVLEMEVVNWNRTVFAALAREEDLVLFTKGIFTVKTEIPLEGARCVFFAANGSPAAYTRVLGIAQEIIRCEYPPASRRSVLLGNKVSVTYGDSASGDAAAPSVAVYREQQDELEEEKDVTPRHTVCACTMVRNVAKFLWEWVLYHSHIGIEKFILYDNNSEDPIHETVDALDGLDVDVVPWPWIKSQEAGLAHCAAARRKECRWMAFVDVDEFIFPKLWLNSNPKSNNTASTVRSSPLARAIAASTVPQRNSTQMVGQISLHCLNFGPSEQSRHPTAGVTQGYTCRTSRVQRHKSLVLLDAVDQSLVNAVHHFGLGSGYSTVTVPLAKGVVNHYKFQAWDEFKQKFERRVSAYVADWKENKNLGSQDRTPGLGNRPEKPADWEQRFCEIQDTELRDYIIKAMAFGDDDNVGLPWQ